MGTGGHEASTRRVVASSLSKSLFEEKLCESGSDYR